MYFLLADLLHRQGDDAHLLIVHQHLYPVRSRYLERRIEADGNVAVPLGLVEERYLGFRFREDLPLVRREEPDLCREFPPSTRPLIDDGEPRVNSGKGIGVNGLEQPHEAEFSAQLLADVVAEDGVGEGGVYL